MPTPPPDTAAILIACLCAQWCGTCNDYRPLFEALHQEFAQARFVWVDIEDEADLVDPIEVENFPTILIAQGVQPHFFGTVLPHLDTLRRLIQSSTETGARPLRDANISALVARLQGR